MTSIQFDPGSFRDPAGTVLHIDNKIYRSVTSFGKKQYEDVKSSGLFDELVQEKLLVPYKEVSPDSIAYDFDTNTSYLLELKKLDFISYPYEWPFSLLQTAATLHLKIHLKALEKGISLSDATAFNIQFDGTNAIFIDHLSLRPYREGEYWYGHRQFCDQFLNPLLLRTMCGVPYNNWYRSSMDGVNVIELNKLIPWYYKCLPKTLLHVTLQAYFQGKHDSQTQVKVPDKKLPLTSFKNMLIELHDWISDLKISKGTSGIWGNYAKNTSYDNSEISAKKIFISEYIKSEQPKIVWDLGCNTAEYSFICLEYGTRLVVGFDSDLDVLDVAFREAKKNNKSFIPLYMDACNPSPSQGWAEIERGGLSERQKPNGVLALALIHHLVIRNNIPLSSVINWIIDFSPSGVIEFVSKNDPMVKKLLTFKDDIFPDYTYETFINLVSKRCKILKEETIIEGNRNLIWYNKK